MCKSHSVYCLIKELVIDNSLGNPTYTLTTPTKEKILDNHMPILCSLEFQPKMKTWIYRHSTGFLNYKCQMLSETSFQIINIHVYFITGQNRLQSYCDTSYSRGGVNQMWILKNSKDLLEYIQSRSLSSCNSIKTFDLSTLYTTIPHS